MLPEVLVFTSAGCGPCKQTKDLLMELNISHRVIDISKDQEGLSQFAKLGFRSVPVVYISNDEQWVGHQPEKIKQLSPRYA